MIYQESFPVYLSRTVNDWIVTDGDDGGHEFEIGAHLSDRGRNGSRISTIHALDGVTVNRERSSGSMTAYFTMPVRETGGICNLLIDAPDHLLPDVAIHEHARIMLEGYIDNLTGGLDDFSVETVWTEAQRPGLESRLVLGFIVNHVADPEEPEDIDPHLFGYGPGSIIHPSAMLGQADFAHRTSTAIDSALIALHEGIDRTIAVHSQPGGRLAITPLSMRYMLTHFPDAYHVVVAGTLTGSEPWSHGNSLHQTNHEAVEWFGTRTSGPSTMHDCSIVGTPGMGDQLIAASHRGNRPMMYTQTMSSYPDYPTEQTDAMAAYFNTPHIATLRNAGGFPYAVLFADFAIIPAVPHYECDELIDDMHSVLIPEMIAVLGGDSANTDELRQRLEERRAQREAERLEQQRLEEERIREAERQELLAFIERERTAAARTAAREFDLANEQVESVKRSLFTAIRRRDECSIQKIAYEQAEREGTNRDLRAVYDRLEESPRIQSIRASRNTLIAVTETILMQDDRTGVYHSLGECEIHIDTGSGSITYYTSQTIDGCWYNQRAAHVNGNGVACGGDFDLMQVTLTTARDWPSLIYACIAFLESANTEDSAGQYVYKFPICYNPENFGYPAYPDGFDPDENRYDP